MGEEDGEIGGGGRVLRSAPWRAAVGGGFGGSGAREGVWGRWMDAREIQNPYIKTQPGQPANGALNSKQYNERGNVACCRAFLFPFFSILPPRQLFLAFTCLPWDAYTHACDRTMN